MSLFRRRILLRYKASTIIDYIYIDGPDNITAYTFKLYAKNSNDQTLTGVNWYITLGEQYATINQNGLVSIYEGTSNQNITIVAEHNRDVATKIINISYTNCLEIESANTISGISGNVIAKYNSNVVTPTWSITAGNNYATIDNTGVITITGSGTITVQASYNNYTTTKQIELIYDANSSTETTVDEYGNITTETQTTSVDPSTGATVTNTSTEIINSDGSTTSTTTEVIENQDGSTTTTSSITNSDGTSSESTTTVSAPDLVTGAVTTNETTTTTNANGTTTETTTELIENQDGSSTSSSTRVNYDENGNTIGSSENETTINNDGSSESSTTNYDENGDPTSQVNNSVDVNGNKDTQNIEYDENGNELVTGYFIDTSGNPDGSKTFGGDGVNTEFIPFDGSNKGFEMHISFRSLPLEQPNPPIVTDTEDSGSNYLFNIFSAQSPNRPWYGFMMRWALPKNSYGSSSGRLVLQYIGSTSSSLNIATANNTTGLFDFTITYDPENVKYNKKFIITDNLKSNTITAINMSFSDNDLDFTIGYAISQAGTPYRYSNVDVFDFSIKKLSSVKDPSISCDGQEVTISCETVGATIYYRLNQVGVYAEYTTPIAITADTVVQAYAELNNERSNTVIQNCIYDM